MSDNEQCRGNVSRETFDKLKNFEALVLKWTRKINLVSPNTTSNIWERHIEDSIQLANLSDQTENWIDLGSGGGFPGLVVAVLLQENHPKSSVTLIESDKRKAAFLMSAAQALDVSVKVIADRIERVSPMNASTLSARALAPLSILLEYSNQHLLKNGTALFLKGQNWRDELREAQQKWHFAFDVINSKTSTQSAVLKIKNIERK